MKQRPVHYVPLVVWLLLAIMLAAQLLWHAGQKQSAAEYQALREPLPDAVYASMTLGDPILASRLLDLGLQAHDNQPGVSMPFNQLDYPRLVQWLDLSLRLDPRDNYPLLTASQVYSRVNDPQRLRVMLDFIEAKYVELPHQRWRWLAHAALKARHTLKDMDLALRYANTLAAAAGEQVPYWARDLRLILLEDMGEKEAVRTLIGGLLAGGEIKDEAEIRFLTHRLEQLD